MSRPRFSGIDVVETVPRYFPKYCGPSLGACSQVLASEHQASRCSYGVAEELERIECARLIDRVRHRLDEIVAAVNLPRAATL